MTAVLWNGAAWVEVSNYTPPVAPPVIVTTSLGAITQSTSVLIPLAATGTVNSWHVSSGTLPAGLGLNAATGVISGTPATAGAYSVTIRASNAGGFDDQLFTGTVAAASEGFELTREWFVANTGHTTPTGSLTPVSSVTMNTPGQVLEGSNVSGAVVVNAANCVIRNCRVGDTILVNAGASGLLVENVTTVAGENGIMDDGYAPNVTYRRLNLSGGRDGMKLSGTGRLIEESFIHDLDMSGVDPHNDGIQCYSGKDWTFHRLWIECDDTSGIAMFQGQVLVENVTIQDSYFGGGALGIGPAYAIYAPGSDGTPPIRVLNNVFGQWLHGPVTDWRYSTTGWTWAGNTRAGTGAVVNP